MQWRLRWTGVSTRLQMRGSPVYCHPRHSLLRSFLPPWNGCHCRHRRRVRQRCRGCCPGGREASSWTAATLSPTKWWKYEGLGLNCRWWQQSEWQVTLVSDKEIENFDGKFNRWRWYQWKSHCPWREKKNCLKGIKKGKQCELKF